MLAAPKNSRGQRVVIILIISIFLLVDCGFSYLFLLRPLTLGFAARQWPAVPCHVISSEVKIHPGSKNTTYSVEIAYAYHVAEKVYRSSRYRFLSISSSGREGKAQIVARYPHGSRAICYVDPKNPSEAVLERELGSAAWFGLIPLVFMAISLAGIVWAIRGGGKIGMGGMPDGNPNAGQPWLQRPDWAAGRISSSTKKAMLGIWFFAGVWNVVSLPVAGMVLSEHAIHKGNYGPALVLLFPLVGVGLLLWAVNLTRRWLRFGESVFEMACVPGAVGGVLEGSIRLSRPMRPQGLVKLRLNCLARTTTSNGSHGSSTTERVLWQHEEAVEMDAPDAIPVAFYIPGECSETTTLDASNGTLWRLEAKAQMPGVDYAASFEVPVFRREQSAESRAEAAKLVDRAQAEVAAYVQSASSRIRVQDALQGGTEFYFPAGRNLGSAFFLTVFILIWSGVIWFMLRQGAPLLFPVVFGFFEAVMIFAAAYALTGTTRVLVNPAGVAVTSTVLGFSVKKAIPVQEIASIKTKVGVTAGTTVYHDIKIQCRNGKEICVGRDIKDEMEAEWLAAEMTKALARK